MKGREKKQGIRHAWREDFKVDPIKTKGGPCLDTFERGKKKKPTHSDQFPNTGGNTTYFLEYAEGENEPSLGGTK